MKEKLREAFHSALPIFIGLTLTVIFFFCIFRFDGIAAAFSNIITILKPFVYGGVIAYLLKTPYNWVEDKLKKHISEKRMGLIRGLSVVIVLVAAALLIYLLLVMVIPALVNSIVSVIKSIPPALAEFDKFISEYTTGNEVLNNYIEEWINGIQNNGLDWVKDSILPGLQGLMTGLTSTFGSIFGILYNLLIGIIICVYLLLGKSNFARQGKMLLYAIFNRDVADKVLKEIAFIDKTFVGFFGGKILDSAIVGLICYVFCLILHFTLGMNNAILIAVIVGVTNVIPFFGPYIGAIPSALIILIDSPMCCVLFVIFVIILQAFDGNVLGPLLLSESVGLTGFWVLFSITLFGGLFGFAGILCGVPVFAVIYDLIRRVVYKQLNKHEVTEFFPEPGEGEDDPKKKKSGKRHSHSKKELPG